MAAHHGRRWMNRLQRYQRDASYERTLLLTNGTCRRSMLRPAKPRMAGSRVTDAAITTSTASTTVNANPFMAGWPISRMPSMEMTTVRPANSTARPAVAIAVCVAPRASWPSARLLRNRVTISSA